MSQNQSQKKWRNSIDYHIVRAKIWEHSSTVSFENSQHNVQEDGCIGESPIRGRVVPVISGKYSPKGGRVEGQTTKSIKLWYTGKAETNVAAFNSYL